MNYEIFLAGFPFVDSPEIFKTRPIIPLTQPFGKHNLVLCAYISTNIEEVIDVDIVLESNEENGLKKASVITLHKIQAIPLSKIHYKIGDIDSQTSQLIRNNLAHIFKIN
jgi:mRNA-degrading endonuclease toxin of MazEF toxin-antitoxin module